MQRHLLGLRFKLKKIRFLQIFKTMMLSLNDNLKIKIVFKTNLKSNPKTKCLINLLADFSQQKFNLHLVKVIGLKKVFHLFLCSKNPKKIRSALLATQKKFQCPRKTKMEYLVNNFLLHKLLYKLNLIFRAYKLDNLQGIHSYNHMYLKTFLKKLSSKQKISYRIMIYKMKVLH